jgi:hypothetical protein
MFTKEDIFLKYGDIHSKDSKLNISMRNIINVGESVILHNL